MTIHSNLYEIYCNDKYSLLASSSKGFIVFSPCHDRVIPIVNDKFCFENQESLFIEYIKYCFDKSIEPLNQKVAKNLSSSEIAEYWVKNNLDLNEDSEYSFLIDYNSKVEKEFYERLKGNKNPYKFSRITYNFKPYFIVYNDLNDRGLDGNWYSLINKSFNWCQEYKSSDIHVCLPNSKNIIPWMDKEKFLRRNTAPVGGMFNVSFMKYLTSGER